MKTIKTIITGFNKWDTFFGFQLQGVL